MPRSENLALSTDFLVKDDKIYIKYKNGPYGANKAPHRPM